MKLSKLTLIAFLLVVGLTQIADAADPQELCKSMDFMGTYRPITSRGPHHKKIQMLQTGCKLLVKDFENKAVWELDLTGESEFQVPNNILARNRKSEEGYRSLKSLKARARIVEEENFPGSNFNSKMILLEGTVDVPRSGNHNLDITIEFKAKFIPNPTFTTNNGRTVVEGIRVETTSFRVIRIRDPILKGSLSEAFITGANYILSMFDESNFTRVFTPDLELTKVSKNLQPPIN